MICNVMVIGFDPGLSSFSIAPPPLFCLLFFFPSLIFLPFSIASPKRVGEGFQAILATAFASFAASSAAAKAAEAEYSPPSVAVAPLFTVVTDTFPRGTWRRP